MATKETTAKLTVDISDLKKGIQEAQRSIRLANAEFKSASSAMDDWGKSSDGISKKIEQLQKVLAGQEKILSVYKQQLEKIVAEEGETSKGAEEMRIKIANQEAVVNKTAKELEGYKDNLQKITEEENKSVGAFEKLDDEIKAQEKALEEVKTKYKDVVLEQGKNSDSARELANEIDKLSTELSENKKSLNDVEKSANDLDKSFDETSKGGLNSFGVALGNLVANVISDAISKMKDLVKETINVGIQFDSSMSKVSAVSGATGEDLEMLRDKAKELGSSTKFTASEVADGFNYMAMAGWKTEDMMSGIEGVLNLASASGTDLATTSDIVTDALTAMGYSASDSGRLADVLASASSNANTNVQMMGETFKYVAPLAGAMGYSMEDTATAIGLMANSGIKSTQAGTSLRAVLTRLAKPTDEVQVAMDALGISITKTNEDGSESMKSLNEVMLNLREAFGGLKMPADEFESAMADLANSQAELDASLASGAITEKEYKKATAELSDKEEELAERAFGAEGALKAQYASTIAGKNALSGLMAIVSATDSDFENLSEAINNSSGTAEEMAGVMENNLGGDLTKLSSQFEGLQLDIYEKLEPALRDGVEMLSGLLDGFQWIVDHMPEVVSAITAVATAVGAYVAFQTALTVMKNGWKALTVVTKAQEMAQLALNTVMSMNPIGLIIALIAGLVAGFITLWNTSEDFREFWIGLWETIKEKAGKVIDSVVGFFKNLWKDIKDGWGIIKKGIASIPAWFNNTIVQPVARFFSGMWDNVTSGAKKAWEGIKSAFGAVASWFHDTFSKAWQKVKDVFSTGGKVFDGIKEGITNAFKTVVNAIIKGINKVISIPFTAINGVLGKIKNVKIGGFQPFKALIGEISTPQIPLLEKGGILAKGQVGLLEGNGAEAVVPLDRNKKWISATARTLRSMLEADGTIQNMGDLQNTVVNNNYSYVQHNTSPKALSRLEIYRQTRNQLAFFQGGV